MTSTTAHSDIIASKDPSAYITKDRQTLRGKRVGPILHLADERARLAQLTWNHFEIKRLGATIGAEISGMLMVIRRVRRVDGSADSGVISLYAGTSNTSSKVIAS